MDQRDEAESSTPLTLDAMLEMAKPSMDVRLRLAHEMAESVHHFHKVGWLHKCISSANVLVFKSCQARESRTEVTERLYLMGFNHSRPDEENAFTEGPSIDPNQLDYQHPEYLKGHQRYRPEFDHFSLGLVLLEIGLWKTLRSRTRKLPPGTTPEGMHGYVLQQLVPQLRFSMGSRYEEAVRFCVRGEIKQEQITTKTSSDTGRAIQRHLKFEENVVAQLKICLSGCASD